MTATGIANKEPLPEYYVPICERLVKDEIISHMPNHILLNEYYPCEGIMAHTDGKAYYPVVSNISMNSGLVLNFYKNHEERLEGIYLA